MRVVRRVGASALVTAAALAAAGTVLVGSGGGAPAAADTNRPSAADAPPRPLPPVDLGPAAPDEGPAAQVNRANQVLITGSGDQPSALWVGGRRTALTFNSRPIQRARLNDRGQVAGVVVTRTDTATTSQAVLWDRGRVRTLPITGDLVLPLDINNSGQVVALSATLSAPTGVARAYLYDGHTARDLGVVPSLVYPELFVNDAGQVAGNATGAGGAVYGSPRAFLWDRGHLVDLGPTAGDGSTVSALGEDGEVVGRGSGGHAMRWTPSSATDLGTLGGDGSGATAVNGNGQVVGWSDTAAGTTDAFVWSDGRMTALGIPSGHATDIDSRGAVVATGAGPANEPDSTSGYLWRDGRRYPLGTLGGPSTEPDQINDLGIVVGFSQVASGDGHAALWIAT